MTTPSPYRRAAATARATLAVAVAAALTLSATATSASPHTAPPPRATGTPSTAPTAPADGRDDGLERLLVRAPADAPVARALSDAAGTDVRALDDDWLAVSGPAGLRDLVERAGGDVEVQTDPPAGPLVDHLERLQWHLDHPERPEADISRTHVPDGYDGRGVVVAVIDSGVQLDHPDLAGAVWTNDAEVAGNGIDDDGNGFVDDVHGWDFANDDATVDDADGDNRHGTHVATTVAGVRDGRGVVGVAPAAQVMPVKVLHRGSFPTSRLVPAIDYAVANGADVINLSVGTAPGVTEIEPLRAALARAHAAGVVTVAAAGNDGVDIGAHPVQPASTAAPGVITVGASGRDAHAAGFSNHGLPVELHAPGVGILAGVPYATWSPMSGTSMAAPVVSGIAALVVQSGVADPDAVVAAVVDGAVRLEAFDGLSSSGARADAAGALVAAGATPPRGSDDGPDPGPSPGDRPGRASFTLTVAGADQAAAGRAVDVTLHITGAAEPALTLVTYARGQVWLLGSHPVELAGRRTTLGAGTSVATDASTRLRTELPAGFHAFVVTDTDGRARVVPFTVGQRPIGAASPSSGSPLAGDGRIAPASGPVSGATAVTILDVGPDASAVRIGDTTVRGYRFGAELRLFTRAHPAGVVDVTVLDSDGEALEVLPGAFEFTGAASAPQPPTPAVSPSPLELSPLPDGHPLAGAGLLLWLRSSCRTSPCTGATP